MKNYENKESKQEVLVFFLVTIILTWFLWIPALLIQNYGYSLLLPYDWFIRVGTFIPSIAGFILAYIFGGKKEIQWLLKSLVNVHIRIKWILFIFLFLPGVSALSCFVFEALGNSLPQMQFEARFIPIVFVYILVFMGPLGEEAGWRGFALKRMLQNSSPIKAGMVIGLIWSIWHLPLFFINGTTQNVLIMFGMFPAFFGYLLYTVMISFLITLLFIMTNGSVFGSILLHTVGNMSLGVVPLIFLKKGAFILLFILCITTIAIIYKYKKVMFIKS